MKITGASRRACALIGLLALAGTTPATASATSALSSRPGPGPLASAVAPASTTAAPQGSELTDACLSELPAELPDTNEFGTVLAVGPFDACGGAVTGSRDQQELRAIRISLQLDGDTGLGAHGVYQVGWRTGGCTDFLRYELGSPLGAAPRLTFTSTCGAAQVPCDPEVLEDLGFFCIDLGDAETVELPASSARAAGRTLTVTLDPTQLPGAGRFTPGATLEGVYALTFVKAGEDLLPGDYADAERPVVL